jgi:hypothetical protein
MRLLNATRTHIRDACVRIGWPLAIAQRGYTRRPGKSLIIVTVGKLAMRLRKRGGVENRCKHRCYETSPSRLQSRTLGELQGMPDALDQRLGLA